MTYRYADATRRSGPRQRTGRIARGDERQQQVERDLDLERPGRRQDRSLREVDGLAEHEIRGVERQAQEQRAADQGDHVGRVDPGEPPDSVRRRSGPASTIGRYRTYAEMTKKRITPSRPAVPISGTDTSPRP